MVTQGTLFPEATGEALKNIGIRRAEANANLHYEDWSQNAFVFLCNWLNMIPAGRTFLAEDIRNQAEFSKSLPTPPSKRAWGGIINRARNSGLIKAIGTEKVRNPTAHQANATLWQKI